MISAKSAKALIQELNETDETEHLEAKEISGSDVGKSFYETVCALSNEPDLGGGTILLGVEKEQALFPLYSASGVSEPDKIASDIASGCSTTFNIPVRVDISQEKVGEKVVVRVDVPELQRNQKPLYFKSQGLPRGAFRRSGPTDVRCTDEDLLAFFHNKTHEPYDSCIADDAVYDDLDESAIGAYRRARSEVNRLAEELTWTDEDMLYALGAIKRSNESIKITVTGLVMFGKQAALRRLFPSHRVDYIRVPGSTWVSDPERVFESVDMRGPVLTLLPRVIAAIIDDLPKAFGIDENGSGQRTELPVIPYRVIREAVVNSLMHRSYQIAQPIQIVRYSNRIEIKNPGYSLKSQERFDEPGSLIRNPHIAEILHETRFAETKGSGIRVMRKYMANSGLSSPTFDSDRDNDEFRAIFLLHHFLNEKDWEWLSQFKSMDLTEDQMRALIFMREVGAIDNSTYRSLTQSDTLSASKSLRHLRSLNLISDRGSGARTYYVPGPTFPALGAANMDASMDASGNKMYGKSGDRLASASDLPPELRLRVQSIGKRLEPEKARSLIVDLCRWRPLSAEEIASFIKKTTSYVSQKYLYGMVRDGRLVYLYPEMVKHPGQKYRAADSDNEGSS
jgi:ATP-dependent DNA helicase RecG